MTATVENRPPPDAAIAILSRVVRAVAATRAHRLIPFPAAVLRFTGRRSGRSLAIVANVWDVHGTPTVITERAWRLNFQGGREVTVDVGGRRRTGTGTLVEDPEQVAAAFNEALAAGGNPRHLAVKMDAGHTITPDDVRALGRAIIRLELRD